MFISFYNWRKESMSNKIEPMQRILNCNESRNIELDWQFEHAIAALLFKVPKKIPESIDLREAWWSVGDQGSTGSCVGWAAADSVLRWYFVKANRIGANEQLSTRYIWMAAKETDRIVSFPTTFIESEGTSLKTALDIARKYGVVKDSFLPFKSSQLYAGDSKSFYAEAAKLKISSYFNLGTNPMNWKNWLFSKGPILARLNVDDAWDKAFSTKGNLDVYHPNVTRGGHAVALVGYTQDRFIVRNSWGATSWGDKGFGYASLAYAQNAFVETYGVSL
jgi:C1A family cysteine protease